MSSCLMCTSRSYRAHHYFWNDSLLSTYDGYVIANASLCSIQYSWNDSKHSIWRMGGEERRCGSMRLRYWIVPHPPFDFEEGVLVSHENVPMAGNPPKNQGAGCAWRNRRGRGARTASEGFMRAPCQSRSKENRHDVLWRKKVGEKDVWLGVHIIGRSPSTRGLPSWSIRRGLRVKNKTGLVVVLVTRTVICRAVSLDENTFREAEQGGWCGRVENLSKLESWSQEGSGSITKSHERSRQALSAQDGQGPRSPGGSCAPSDGGAQATWSMHPAGALLAVRSPDRIEPVDSIPRFRAPDRVEGN